MITGFDRVVANMMSKLGTTACIKIIIDENYDTSTSENMITTHDYPVNVMFFDYVRKNEGIGSENGTLIQTGDKQVYVQPPQKNDDGLPLPHFSANNSLLKFGDKLYKIITIKQINPSQTVNGSILYELYIRE
jgi:hypothetical protein